MEMPQYMKNKPLIKRALTAVNNGMSLRQAAARFGCCKSTIHHYVKRGKQAAARRPHDDDPLTVSEEERLGNWLIYCYYLGYFQISQSNLSREADNLLRARGAKGKFNRAWYKQFPKRHAFVQKSLDFYENYRDLNTKFSNKYLGSLLIYCRNQNLFHCLQDPRYMYYCCQLQMTEDLKLIVAYSAQGKTAPPLIVNGNVNDSVEFEEAVMPDGWFKYNCQLLQSGTDQEDAMAYYIEQVLKIHLVKENLNKPMLLFNKYQNYPPALTFFELCAECLVYPVNSLLSAFKLEQSLQTEISVRMKSVRDKQLSGYVDLMKNILMFKLTKQRMCDSFRESGIYPLAVGKMDIKELPRLQMSSTVQRGICTQPQIKNEPGNEHENSVLCQTVEAAETSCATSLKRKHNELNENTVSSSDYKNTGHSSIIPTAEKRPCSLSMNLDKYDQMAFQDFCLDDDDVAVSNEPLQTEDPLCEIKVEIL